MSFCARWWIRWAASSWTLDFLDLAVGDGLLVGEPQQFVRRRGRQRKVAGRRRAFRGERDDDVATEQAGDGDLLADGFDQHDAQALLGLRRQLERRQLGFLDGVLDLGGRWRLALGGVTDGAAARPRLSRISNRQRHGCLVGAGLLAAVSSCAG